MRQASFVLSGLVTFVLTAGTAFAGTVTGVTVSPASVATGAAVTVTVSGSNPCGAAHVIYGDGAAITYAITGLPITRPHTYAKPGTYTITAKGMGNCDGEAAATVTVTGSAQPEPPPTPAGSIGAVQITPSPARLREPVTVAVGGTGVCAYEVHFGDGAAQEVNGRLPQQFYHAYVTAKVYTVIVKPVPPCTGKFSQQLEVVDAAAPARRITRLLVSPTPADAGQPVAISVEGAGACAYTIDFGDGNTEAREARELPDRLQHNYPAPGVYNLAVRPESPCSGAARARLDVRRR